MKTTYNCLFIDTNIHIYVPFCKSVDDVTIRLSLRHHFLPGLKITMEHNLNITFEVPAMIGQYNVTQY